MTGLDPISMLAIAGAAATLIFLPNIGRKVQRAAQLRQAVELLREHDHAIEVLSKRVDVDSDLRRHILDIADVLADDEMVRRISYLLLNEAPRAGVPVDGESFETSLFESARENPELFMLLHDGIQAGFLGAFLRVPETAEKFDQLFTSVITGQERAVQAAERMRTPYWPSQLGGAAPMPA